MNHITRQELPLELTGQHILAALSLAGTPHLGALGRAILHHPPFTRHSGPTLLLKLSFITSVCTACWLVNPWRVKGQLLLVATPAHWCHHGARSRVPSRLFAAFLCRVYTDFGCNDPENQHYGFSPHIKRVRSCTAVKCVRLRC